MMNRHWKAVARMHAIVVGVPVGLVAFAVDLCKSVIRALNRSARSSAYLRDRGPAAASKALLCHHINSTPPRQRDQLEFSHPSALLHCTYHSY
jgi:hypothetical protein